MNSPSAAAIAVRDEILDAVEHRTPLRIAGQSRWIDAGRPVQATRILPLAAHDAITDYVPGDLTITVGPGATLGEIARATAAEGQWLPLDPAGGDGGSIGATVATASYGPLATAFGRPRDLVLGIEFVTGEGKIVRGGGRVVKNVAGFDLVRLITGSWGSLGVVTEVTLRLYSKPAFRSTVCLYPRGSETLGSRLAVLREAPLAPLAMELLDANAARLAGLPHRPTILVELGGNSAVVSAQLDTLSRLATVEEAPREAWERLRAADEHGHSGTGTGGQVTFRLSVLPSRTAELWTALDRAAEGMDGFARHATLALGVVRCICAPSITLPALGSLQSVLPDLSVVWERLPPGMWPEISPGVVPDRLSQGILRTFDPHALLNPGIMGPRN